MAYGCSVCPTPIPVRMAKPIWASKDEFSLRVEKRPMALIAQPTRMLSYFVVS